MSFGSSRQFVLGGTTNSRADLSKGVTSSIYQILQFKRL